MPSTNTGSPNATQIQAPTVALDLAIEGRITVGERY
jgi:hypothetical protein